MYHLTNCFEHFCALMNTPTSATTSATQVLPKMHLLLLLDVNRLGASSGASSGVLSIATLRGPSTATSNESFSSLFCAYYVLP